MKKINVYVSGPYSAPTRGAVEGNIRRAKKLGQDLLSMGFNVYVPHTHTAHWDEETTVGYEVFMDLHMSFLEEWADVVFFLGESPGANAEREFAESRGIPVVGSVEDLEEKVRKIVLGKWR